MAWLIAQGNDIIPIPGSKQLKYVEENVGAANIKLSDEEIKKIRVLCDEVEKATAEDKMNPAWTAEMNWTETPLP